MVWPTASKVIAGELPSRVCRGPLFGEKVGNTSGLAAAERGYWGKAIHGQCRLYASSSVRQTSRGILWG